MQTFWNFGRPPILLAVLLTVSGANPSCEDPDTPTPGDTPTPTQMTETPAETPTETLAETQTPVGTPPPSDSDNEASLPGCSDGLDNDGDGYTDCDDWSCFQIEQGASEAAQAYCFEVAEASGAECQDGIDNDEDGFTDCDDWSCYRPEYGATEEAMLACGVEPTPTPTEPVGCVDDDGICATGCSDEEDSDCGGEWSCGEVFPVDVPYLEGVEDLEDTALETALHNLTNDQQSLSYDAARDRMYGDVDDIDVDSDGYIECIYTGYRTMATGSSNPGSITTEHSWPQSEGASGSPMKGDIHHLFPASSESNNARGSYEFGNTNCGTAGNGSCQWSGGGSKSGSSTDGRGTVFQVRPEFRGDIARAHFYFSMRYNDPISAKEEAVLKQWHCEDPPNADEIRRTGDIENWENIRNPFVDRPDFVLQISDF